MPGFSTDPATVQIGSSSLLGYINSIAVSFGIPIGIAQNLVAQEDPSLQFDIRGSSGEIGLAQVLPSTAAEVDPGGNYNLNDPLDNLVIGFKYLAGLKSKYGTWNQALQAYNSGSPSGAPGYAQSVLTGVDPTSGAPLSILSQFDPSQPILQTISNGVVQIGQTGSQFWNAGPAAFDPSAGTPNFPSVVAASDNSIGAAFQRFLNIFANDAAGNPDANPNAVAVQPTVGSTVANLLPGGGNVTPASASSITWPGVIKYGFAGLVVVGAVIVGLYVLGKSATEGARRYAS